MALFDGERIGELRLEIAELRKAILATRNKKGYPAEKERARQLERLEEIKAQLKSLQEQNKTVN